MSTPRILILRAPGTNCDRETAYAFERVGAQTTVVHVQQLLADPGLLQQFQVLCVPGGFSYGDDIAAGRILGNQMQHHLRGQLCEFKDAGKLVLGICNGFQVLLKTGLLLDDRSPDSATLTWNGSGKYEDRWVHLASTPTPCVFLRNVTTLYLPVAHAEGKFVTKDATTLAELAAAGRLPLRYVQNGGHYDEAVPYPANPNGAQANVAGLCDSTGRVFGLMPHPERHIDPTHHPRWTRSRSLDTPDGLAIFQNAVEFFA
jgi:phosphoribosylformylglycinamidine synthase I